jgi:Ni/Fe-hydrogenase subunit HybB-like protein
MPGVEGFMYPNEVELQWSVLIVLYPFLTGLVAGAFILASLERVFQVEAVKPTYRLALLTALAFLLVAPLPLQLHLGHPERSYEMYLTPHKTLRHGHVRVCVSVVPDGVFWCWKSGSTTGVTSCCYRNPPPDGSA